MMAFMGVRISWLFGAGIHLVFQVGAGLLKRFGKLGNLPVGHLQAPDGKGVDEAGEDDAGAQQADIALAGEIVEVGDFVAA